MPSDVMCFVYELNWSLTHYSCNMPVGNTICEVLYTVVIGLIGHILHRAVKRHSLRLLVGDGGWKYRWIK